MDTDRAEIAHLLKRTRFLVRPERVEELAAKGWAAALAEEVDNAAPPQAAACPDLKNRYVESAYEDFLALVDFEMKRLADPAGDGLGNRMLWFWHNLLTSDSKAEPGFLCRQHQLLARHALGNFGDMVKDITLDPAMLIYLDGAYSYGASPNQNYSRELKELFTLGRGNYTQRDVEAGAYALSGWELTGGNWPPNVEGDRFFPDRVRAVFNPDAAYLEPVTYLGVTRLHDVNSVVDTILAQDVCARYIARRVFQYFVHQNPAAATVNELAAVFRNANYEIRPLLAATFRHPEFRGPAARRARVRFPMETLLAAAAALAVPVETFDMLAYFYATSFLPFEPPNVAGWPLGGRWLSATHSGARARLSLVAFDLPKQNRAVKAVFKSPKPVEEALRQTALYEVSPQTRAALERFAASESNRKNRARGLLALAVSSPDFALA